VVVLGAKVPVPEDVQRPPVAPPPTDPPNPAVLLLAQIVWLAPAVTTANLFTVTTACADRAVQGARSPVEVSVSVTVPVEASASDGV